MIDDHFFHFTRVNIGAAADDHVLGTIEQKQIPVLVERADVAGMQPAVAHCLCSGFRIVPVAHHDDIAAHHDAIDVGDRQREFRPLQQAADIAKNGADHCE